MGTPNKASSLSVLNGFDVYPSLYGSSPLMSNRIILLAVGPTSFVLPVHNQGASLATIQGHALWFNFLPATSSFFVLSLLIQTLRLQHLSADAYCNHYGCSLLLGYAAFNCSPGCLISFNIFDASYLIPLVRIAWNTLISLHATTISDCIFFNGFFSLVV